MKNLSLRQLRIFTAAARHSSSARAAEELHLTAPAVSMQIIDLKADLRISLFMRQGRGVGHTSAGEYFEVYKRRQFHPIGAALFSDPYTDCSLYLKT